VYKAKLQVIKTAGIKKRGAFILQESLLLAFPLVRVDVFFPVKSGGKLDFPMEWLECVPLHRTVSRENFPKETSPVKFLQDSCEPNGPPICNHEPIRMSYHA
jgi:hypothetical protein